MRLFVLKSLYFLAVCFLGRTINSDLNHSLGIFALYISLKIIVHSFLKSSSKILMISHWTSSGSGAFPSLMDRMADSTSSKKMSGPVMVYAIYCSPPWSEKSSST